MNANSRLSVRAVLASSWRFASSGDAWARVLRLGWWLAVPYVLLLAWQGYWTAELARRYAPPADPTQIENPEAIFASVILIVIGSFAPLWLLAAAMRVRAADQDAAVPLRHWKRLGVCVLWWSMVISLATIIPFLAGVVLLSPIYAAVATVSMIDAPPGTAKFPAGLAAVFFLSAAAVAFFAVSLFIRWFLTVAARATGRRLTAGQAWALGRGHGLRFATIVSVSHLALPALFGLVSVFFVFPPMFAAVQPGAPPVLPDPAVNAAVSSALAATVVFSSVWSGAAWVDAYRTLSGGAGGDGGSAAVNSGGVDGGG